jgi:hypothetical protein
MTSSGEYAIHVAGAEGSSPQATWAPLATLSGVMSRSRCFRSSFGTLSSFRVSIPPFSVTLCRSTQVPSEFLLSFNSLKQRFEIPGAESVEVVALDDLDEHRWTVHEVLQMIRKSASSQQPFQNAQEQPYLREKLQQISTLIKIDQNVKPLERLEILLQLQTRSFKPLCH